MRCIDCNRICEHKGERRVRGCKDCKNYDLEITKGSKCYKCLKLEDVCNYDKQ